jgi:hypothetical protein
MANPILRIKRGSSTPASLSSGELAMDLSNLSLFVGQADGTPLAIGGSGTFATKSYADAAVSAANSTLTAAIAAEEAARISADSTLSSNLSAEESARIAADSTLTSDIASEVSRATTAEGVIASDLATETSARTSADSALDAKIATEKGRVDAILSAADADKDSFAEIVSLINSVDTANDSAFAGYVTSNNAALASEVSARTSADSALDSRATVLETKTQNITATAGETDVAGILTSQELWVGPSSSDAVKLLNPVAGPASVEAPSGKELVIKNGAGNTAITVIASGNGKVDFAYDVSVAQVLDATALSAGSASFGSMGVNSSANFNGGINVNTGNLVGNGTNEITDFIIDGGTY